MGWSWCGFCTLAVGVLLVGCNSINDGVTVSEFDDEGANRVEPKGEKFLVVPSSMSADRISRVGLSTDGSEDVSHLLSLPEGLSDWRPDEPKDCRPNDASEWVLDVEFEGSPVHQLARLQEMLGFEWMSTVGNPTIFGWSPEIEAWTYLISSDGPKTFTKLAFSWPIYDALEEEYESEERLDLFTDSVAEKVQELGTPTLRQNRTPREAEQLGARIHTAVVDFDRNAIVVLRANSKPFRGPDIWDVMHCLGLHWGDGDLFHWRNPSGHGDDLLFSVWTSTPPGFFFPEEIAAGRVATEDLVFGYSIPRSADPVVVLDSMLRAVKYAQQRLDGVIVDEEGQRLDEDELRRDVSSVVDGLNAAGFKPGASSTLHAF